MSQTIEETDVSQASGSSMRAKLLRFAREPLPHFIIIGATFYLLFGWFGQTESHVTITQENTIVVTKGEMKWLAQLWQKRWNRPPSKEEMLGLLLIVKSTSMLVKTVTAFTVAHSITLAIATLGYASTPLPPLNVLIALSILFLGPEIVQAWRGQTSFTIRHPWVVAFVFGLLHGFGFASGLKTIGLPAWGVSTVGGLFGLLHGLLNGAALQLANAGVINVLGIVTTVFVLLLLVSAVVVSLRPAWTRIAVRVAGSWVVAVGMLMFGWMFRAS